MCGIAGIINKSDRPVSSAEIRAITNPVIHRGPDNEGFYFGSNFAFGHRRLSIIDLSESANQPMTYKSRNTITYNGEIYNYIEIRNQLIKLGYKFKTVSDTEVILAAYDCYGENCVRKFNGMWSFAIYDPSREIIFCSRDRFGVKPFYYLDLHDKFVFGSEIKQLTGSLNSIIANLPIVIDYLVASLDDHSNQTFFKSIVKLEQSHNLIYDLRSHSFRNYRYYELNADNNITGFSEKDSIDYYSGLLTDSVKLRLRSDVRVGACLSGGLDSSGIVSIASSLYNPESNNKFVSVTARSTEPCYDETHYARLVSDHCGLEWHVVTPQYNEFRDDLSRLIHIQEEPFGSPSIYMQYKVFEKAREAGCKVMLDGQGGDETLLGYERYYPAYLISGGWQNFMKNLFSVKKNSNLSIPVLFSYYLYFTLPQVRMMRLKSRFSFIRKDMMQFLNREMLINSARVYRNINELQKDEIETVQLPHLLKYEDRNSMIHSIESRLPFLDYRLVEASLSINNSFKIKDGWTKYLLRKSVENRLPAEITKRKDKVGFNAPESTWIGKMNDHMRGQVKKSLLLKHISGQDQMVRMFEKLDLRARWRLFNIAKWEETFNVTVE